MTELWLNFTDGDGKERRVIADEEKFVVGRLSTADLCVPDEKLSREHIKIERFGDVYVVSDCGSSNGTLLNDEKLMDPVALKNGDRLELGGSIEMTVEMVSDAPAAAPPQKAAAAAPEGVSPTSATPPSVSPAASSGEFPTWVFIAAPVLGILVLFFVGGLIYFLAGGDATPSDRDFVYTQNDEGDDPADTTPDRTPKTTDPDNTATSDDPGNTSQNNDPGNALPTPKNLSDSGKSEQNAAEFLRRIAQNDPKAFITGEQAVAVSGKIKQVGGSSALVDNINSARKSSAQIRSLATAKNLKPQFLAAAAITKLGSSRGDVLQTAQGMAETFDKLGTQIGSELANDSLLMVAAYDQGAAGDFLKMRNMLQDIATKFPESSRSIRTIWFLHKQGKITDGEYDFALRFLAVGTIMQNPKDFGVNTEALVL
jgi:hypothetical protein